MPTQQITPTRRQNLHPGLGDPWVSLTSDADEADLVGQRRGATQPAASRARGTPVEFPTSATTPPSRTLRAEAPDDTKTPDKGEANSDERWIEGKSEEELLADLRVYAARLRDNPHSLQDRLRVGAIQLRLGRIDEALIHYEGVVRGYVEGGQLAGAIALAERLVRLCPDRLRWRQILVVLYARAPRVRQWMKRPVMPVAQEDRAFLLTTETEIAAAPLADGHGVTVERLFSQPLLLDRPIRRGFPARGLPGLAQLADADDPPWVATMHAAPVLLLTQTAAP